MESTAADNGKYDYTENNHSYCYHDRQYWRCESKSATVISTISQVTSEGEQ